MHMKTISLPRAVYNNLVKKARVAEQFLTMLEKQYPLEEYDKKRLGEFKTNDSVSPQLKKDITIILNHYKKSA